VPRPEIVRGIILYSVNILLYKVNSFIKYLLLLVTHYLARHFSTIAENSVNETLVPNKNVSDGIFLIARSVKAVIEIRNKRKEKYES